MIGLLETSPDGLMMTGAETQAESRETAALLRCVHDAAVVAHELVTGHSERDIPRVKVIRKHCFHCCVLR